MSIWKDKNGLHQQVSEPTIVEETLAELNKLEAEWNRMTLNDVFHDHRKNSGEQVKLKEKLREQGVTPYYSAYDGLTHLLNGRKSE